MKRILILLMFGALAAAWASAASAAAFRGVVVGKQRGGMLVASPSGVVRAVNGHASVGARVTLSGGRLAVVGRSHTAVVRGIVVRHIGSMLFLSSNRHLVAVHTGRRLADSRPAPTTPATSPKPGDLISTQVSIAANGQLVETQQTNLGASGENTIQVQALVAAVGVGTVSLTVQGQTLMVPLPSGLTLPTSLVGQTVTVSLELAGANDDDGGDDDGGGGNHGGGGDGGDGGGD